MATPSKRNSGGPVARFVAALAVVGMAGMIVYVVWAVRAGAHDGPPQFFDPLTTNPDELRRVTEAVSRIIAASPDQHEVAVQTLESVRVTSAGARDLKDSCVNTYRGTIRAESMLREMTALLGAPDGGERAATTITPADRTRAVELQHQVEDQIELVNQSKDRCMDLYTEATRTMGITAARRWERHR